MEEEKNKNNEKHIILLVLILFILIIIVFLLAHFLGIIDHTPLIPTGNIDIFDINFIKDNNECICDNKNNTGSNSNICDNSKPDNVSGNSDKYENGTYVYDNNTSYSKNTSLNIFTQTAYHVVDGTIAPLSKNSYQFIIRNNNDFNIKYNLEITETNEYNIDMRFRLKINGIYVVGSKDSYVSADELNQYDISLADKNYNVYTLDWKWFESSNDTEVGMNVNSKYKLGLVITASEY